MADKRMFSLSVVDTDWFLDLPLSTQALYFHLNLRADDDGFVDAPNSIVRKIGASKNDFDLLVAKRYVLKFESGIIVIKHWRMHNTIQKDRYHPTQFQEELNLLSIKDNKSYTDKKCIQDGYEMDTKRIQNVSSGLDLGLDIDLGLDNKKEMNKEKASSEATHTYGEYKRIRLKDSQYKKLVDEFGENKTQLAITKLDEYVQSNNNKNKYKDFYLVLRKVIKEDWFHISKDVQSASDTNIDELVKEVRSFKGDDDYIEQVLSWKGIDADTIKKVLDAVNNEIVWDTL